MFPTEVHSRWMEKFSPAVSGKTMRQALWPHVPPMKKIAKSWSVASILTIWIFRKQMGSPRRSCIQSRCHPPTPELRRTTVSRPSTGKDSRKPAMNLEMTSGLWTGKGLCERSQKGRSRKVTLRWSESLFWCKMKE